MIIDLYNTNMSLQEALFSALPGDEIILAVIADDPRIRRIGENGVLIGFHGYTHFPRI